MDKRDKSKKDGEAKLASPPGEAESEQPSFPKFAVPPTRRRRFSGFSDGLIKSDIDEILQIVTADEQAFYGERIVYFAGFCAWVISPYDKRLIRDAILIRAEEENQRFLQSHAKVIGRSRQVSLIEVECSVRQHSKYSPFYAEFYSEIHKRKLDLEKRSLKAIKKAISDRREFIQFVLKLMCMLHNVAQLPTEEFYPPGVERGEDIFAKLSHMGFKISGGTSPNSVHKRWSESRPAAAFLYAAHLLKDDKGRPLLHLLLRRKLTYSNAKPYLRTWFGYANYLTSNVLVHSIDSRDKVSDFPLASGIELLAPPCPQLSDDDIKILTDAFRKPSLAQMPSDPVSQG